jgi:hypothetical protein
MSDIDPLIKREMQWMAVSVNDNRDLAPIIIAKVRRQRIRNAIFAILGIFAISAGSIGIYELLKSEPIQVVGGITGENSATQPEILGLISDYPIEWEQSVGDVAAISAGRYSGRVDCRRFESHMGTLWSAAMPDDLGLIS